MKIGGPLYTLFQHAQLPQGTICLAQLILLGMSFGCSYDLLFSNSPETNYRFFQSYVLLLRKTLQGMLKKNCRIIMFSVLVIQFYVTNHSKSLQFKTMTIYYFSWFCSLVGRVCYQSHFRSYMCLRSAGGQSGLEGSSGHTDRAGALSGLAGSLGHFCLPLLGFCLSRLSPNFFYSMVASSQEREDVSVVQHASTYFFQLKQVMTPAQRQGGKGNRPVSWWEEWQRMCGHL